MKKTSNAVSKPAKKEPASFDSQAKTPKTYPHLDAKTFPKEVATSPRPAEPVRYSGSEAGEGDWEVRGRCTDF